MLVERVPFHGLAHGRQDAAGPVAAQGGGRGRRDGGEVFVVDRGEELRGGVRGGDVRRAPPLPLPQRRHETVHRLVRVLCGAGLPDQAPEGRQVQLVRPDPQQIAPRTADQAASRCAGGQLRFEQASQRAHVPVHGIGRAAGRVLVPEQTDELPLGDRVSGAGQQRRQHDALLAGAGGQFGAGGPDPDRAQDREAHGGHGGAVRRFRSGEGRALQVRDHGGLRSSLAGRPPLPELRRPGPTVGRAFRRGHRSNDSPRPLPAGGRETSQVTDARRTAPGEAGTRRPSSGDTAPAVPRPFVTPARRARR
ncbi:hypothetical protein SUDANB126_07034 [Streptomyces sp. enrichment culture]